MFDFMLTDILICLFINLSFFSQSFFVQPFY